MSNSNNFNRSQTIGGAALGAETAFEGTILEVNTRWFLPTGVSNVFLPDGINLVPGDFIVMIKAIPEEYKPTITVSGGYRVFFKDTVHSSGSFTLTKPLVLYWSGSEWQDEVYTPTDALNANSSGATIMTESGNYTVPPSASTLTVTLVAGGGGGGGGGAASSGNGTAAGAGGGGGGGGAIVDIPLVATPNEVIPVVIGSGGGGAAGKGSTNNGTITGRDGYSGGTTSFGSTLSVSGGGGGNGGHGEMGWRNADLQANQGGGGTATLTPNVAYTVSGGGGAKLRPGANSALGNGGSTDASEYGGGGGGGFSNPSNNYSTVNSRPGYNGYAGIAIINWSA